VHHAQFDVDRAGRPAQGSGRRAHDDSTKRELRPGGQIRRGQMCFRRNLDRIVQAIAPPLIGKSSEKHQVIIIP
jgi:hypothetical protein